LPSLNILERNREGPERLARLPRDDAGDDFLSRLTSGESLQETLASGKIRGLRKDGVGGLVAHADFLTPRAYLARSGSLAWGRGIEAAIDPT
jgi:hypothetical protein